VLWPHEKETRLVKKCRGQIAWIFHVVFNNLHPQLAGRHVRRGCFDRYAGRAIIDLAAFYAEASVQSRLSDFAAAGAPGGGQRERQQLRGARGRGDRCGLGKPHCGSPGPGPAGQQTAFELVDTLGVRLEDLFQVFDILSSKFQWITVDRSDPKGNYRVALTDRGRAYAQYVTSANGPR
jgi:hypothetical protein